MRGNLRKIISVIAIVTLLGGTAFVARQNALLEEEENLSASIESSEELVEIEEPEEEVLEEETEEEEVEEVEESTSAEASETVTIEQATQEVAQQVEQVATTETSVSPTGKQSSDAQEVSEEVADVMDSVNEEATVSTTASTTDFWASLSNRYFYNYMNSAEQAYYDAWYNMCYGYLTTTADIPLYGNYGIVGVSYTDYGLTVDNAYTIAQIFNANNPQFYFLDGTYYLYSETTLYTDVYSTFVSGSTRMGYTQTYQSVVSAAIAEVVAQADTRSQLQAAHDWVCNKVSYNVYASYNQSSASVIFGSESVCAGYSEAYTAICNGAGLSTLSVTSNSHEWNYSYIDGAYYVVDTTFDDQGTIIYNYFLVSNSQHEGYMPSSFWYNYGVPTN